jgi:two-component system, sensor histidine kinase
MTQLRDDRVSRSRYNRERAARLEAEALLEVKGRELFLANRALSEHTTKLEEAVRERTAELEKALMNAEAASTARSRFVATMSHEIRTPLGGLLGMIDLLAMDERDFEKLELLNYAKAAGTGLSRIVNDVLDFSKMEAGVFVFESEHVDIRALVQSARGLYISQDKDVNREFIIKIDDSVPRLFLSDATRIRQVISNLFSNALRYSRTGPIVVRAKATSHPKGVLLRVEVEDFGVGIPSEKIGSLFKDFSQVANPLTAAAQGTGLGLAICKRIVDGIGGSIGVDSSLGSGSTFWFEIPVEIVALNSDSVSLDHAARMRQLTLSNSLVGKNVLIAEDNVINQKLLLAYATKMQLNADLAANGRIALEKFAPDKYDFVLMDIAMPEMDGIEATDRIRKKWPKDKVPPIIALTAHVADAIEEEARLVGVDFILSKPIPYEELKAALINALAWQAPSTIASSQQLTSDQASDGSFAVFNVFSSAAATALLEVFSPEELKDLTSKFVNDSWARLKILLDAHEAGDAEVVSLQAHSLKGGCLALGFSEMAQWVDNIEKHVLQLDDKAVQDLVSKFSAEVSRIQGLLHLPN